MSGIPPFTGQTAAVQPCKFNKRVPRDLPKPKGPPWI
jgi:hypothetical protein